MLNPLYCGYLQYLRSSRDKIMLMARLPIICLYLIGKINQKRIPITSWLSNDNLTFSVLRNFAGGRPKNGSNNHS